MGVITVANSDSAVADLADGVFAVDYNEALVHQVVTAYMAGSRRGTKARKSRSEVRGGGSKPWRQKGLGRARAGSIRSPLWRGGGATFASKPRRFNQKVNRKMYRGAIRSILSELRRQGRLIVVGDFAVDKPKTRELLARLNAVGLWDVLIVTAEHDRMLELASRNLGHVAVQRCVEISPLSLLAFDNVLMTTATAKRIEEILA